MADSPTTGAVLAGDLKPREALLAQTLVGLAGTLVHDFDVVEVLTVLADRCIEVLAVSAAGVMVGYPGGHMRVMASSSETMRGLELFELQSDEGPCPDCYRSGEAIVNRRLATADDWPNFAAVAVEAGFKSVHALPMRKADITIGALNLFCVGEGVLDDADVLAAQALADVATIAIFQHRVGSNSGIADKKLRHALASRTVIEQAKGMVAEDAGFDMHQSFAWLREHARRRNLPLVDIARDVIEGALTAKSVDPVPVLPRGETLHGPAAIGPGLARLRADTLSMLGEMAADASETEDKFEG